MGVNTVLKYRYPFAWHTQGPLRRASLPQRCNDARIYANKVAASRVAFHMTRE